MTSSRIAALAIGLGVLVLCLLWFSSRTERDLAEPTPAVVNSDNAPPRAPELASSEPQTPAPPASTSQSPSAAGKRPVEIRGRVEGLDGSPPEGSLVSLVDQAGGHLAKGPISSDATFRLFVDSGEQPLEWTAHAWIPGRARASKAFEVAGDVIDVVVLLPPVTALLRGVLVDAARRPVPASTFFLTAGGPPSVLIGPVSLPAVGDPRTWDSTVVAIVRTDDYGRFEVKDPLLDPWGRKTPRFGAAWPTSDAFLLVGEHPRQPTFAPGPDSELVVWKLPAFSIRADVRLGEPNPGFVPLSFELVGEQVGSGRMVSGVAVPPVTFLGAVAEGTRSMRWTLRVGSPKHKPFETAIALGPDVWTTTVAVDLQPWSESEMGRIVLRSPFRDARERPIRLLVSVERPQVFGSIAQSLDARPREDGAWEVRLAPGLARLRVEPNSPLGASVLATPEVAVQPGRESFPLLEFPPYGSIRLRLDPPPERESPQLRLRAVPPEGRSLDEPTTVQDGDIEIPAVRAGTWLITTEVDGVPRRAEVVVRPGEEATATLAPAR